MCIRGAYRLRLSARGGVRSRRHLHACPICTVPVGHAGNLFVHPGGMVMSDGEGSGPCRWGRAGRRTAATRACASHPVIASVRHGWSWPGDVPPSPLPLSWRAKPACRENHPVVETTPAGARHSLLGAVAAGVFGCRYLPSNLHSITEAGRTGRIFLLVFSQPKPTCPNYNLGSISLVGSEVSKTQSSRKTFPRGAGMRAGRSTRG